MGLLQKTVLAFFVFFLTSAANATEVSGVITTQTWTDAGSPYKVLDDVTFRPAKRSSLRRASRFRWARELC